MATTVLKSIWDEMSESLRFQNNWKVELVGEDGIIYTDGFPLVLFSPVLREALLEHQHKPYMPKVLLPDFPVKNLRHIVEFLKRGYVSAAEYDLLQLTDIISELKLNIETGQFTVVEAPWEPDSPESDISMVLKRKRMSADMDKKVGVKMEKVHPMKRKYAKHLYDSNTKVNMCIVCSKVFDNNAELKFHMQIHEKDSKYYVKLINGRPPNEGLLCHVCGLDSHSIMGKLNHICDVNSIFEVFKCDLCGREFGEKCIMLAHKQQHVPHKRLICPICLKKFKTTMMLVTHMREHTMEFDSNTIENDSDMSDYEGTLMESIDCGVCLQSFKNGIDILDHKCKISANQPVFTCDICDKTFGEKSVMLVHRQQHMATSKTSCPICAQYIRSVVQLTNHVREHTGECPEVVTKVKFEKPELTDKWGVLAETPNLDTIKRMKTQRQTKPFVVARPHICNICDLGFSSKTRLFLHQQKHSGKSEHQCPHCHKIFTTIANAVAHVNLIHLSKDSKVDISNSESIDNSLISESNNTQIAKGHFQSEQSTLDTSMDESFTNNSKTQQSPVGLNFKCDECEQSFRTEARRLVHNQVHKGKSESVCPVCDKQMGDARCVTIHMQMHLGYNCSNCGANFKVKKQLRIHREECTRWKYPKDMLGKDDTNNDQGENAVISSRKATVPPVTTSRSRSGIQFDRSGSVPVKKVRRRRVLKKYDQIDSTVESEATFDKYDETLEAVIKSSPKKGDLLEYDKNIGAVTEEIEDEQYNKTAETVKTPVQKKNHGSFEESEENFFKSRVETTETVNCPEEMKQVEYTRNESSVSASVSEEAKSIKEEHHKMLLKKHVKQNEVTITAEKVEKKSEQFEGPKSLEEMSATSTFTKAFGSDSSWKLNDESDCGEQPDGENHNKQPEVLKHTNEQETGGMTKTVKSKYTELGSLKVTKLTTNEKDQQLVTIGYTNSAASDYHTVLGKDTDQLLTILETTSTTFAKPLPMEVKSKKGRRSLRNSVDLESIVSDTNELENHFEQSETETETDGCTDTESIGYTDTESVGIHVLTKSKMRGIRRSVRKSYKETRVVENLDLENHIEEPDSVKLNKHSNLGQEKSLRLVRKSNFKKERGGKEIVNPTDDILQTKTDNSAILELPTKEVTKRRGRPSTKKIDNIEDGRDFEDHIEKLVKEATGRIIHSVRNIEKMNTEQFEIGKPGEEVTEEADIMEECSKAKHMSQKVTIPALKGRSRRIMKKNDEHMEQSDDVSKVSEDTADVSLLDATKSVSQQVLLSSIMGKSRYAVKKTDADEENTEQFAAIKTSREATEVTLMNITEPRSQLSKPGDELISTIKNRISSLKKTEITDESNSEDNVEQLETVTLIEDIVVKTKKNARRDSKQLQSDSQVKHLEIPKSSQDVTQATIISEAIQCIKEKLEENNSKEVFSFGSDFEDFVNNYKFSNPSRERMAPKCINGTQMLYRCIKCSKPFLSEVRLLLHIQRHKGVRVRICPICKKLCKTRLSVMAHIQRHIGLRCIICRKKFHTVKQFWQHKQMHRINGKIYKKTCGKCKKILITQASYLKHIEKCQFICRSNQESSSLPKRELYPCTTCKKRFSSKARLLQHEQKHKDKSVLECPICSRESRNKEAAIKHIERHIGFECTVCNKKFSSTKPLEKHQKWHTYKRK